MTLTLIIDNIPAHQRAAALKYGKVEGRTVTIDAAALFTPMPIPDDTTPEMERRKAKQGGCCGEPSEA
jgi:hypothetical protein